MPRVRAKTGEKLGHVVRGVGNLHRPVRLGENPLDRIGNTPLLRLATLTQDLPHVDILGKAEWFNPGGSVKDRAAANIPKSKWISLNGRSPVARHFGPQLPPANVRCSYRFINDVRREEMYVDPSLSYC